MLSIDFSQLSSDAAFVSSVAIALGAVFVVLQIRDNRKLIMASTEQAKAAVIQAKLSTDQLKQNNDLADMEMIMRIYEFANTVEVQTSWLKVNDLGVKSFEEFQRLPEKDKVAFYQIAALFESLGVLVDRGFVSLATIDDMFVPEGAWQKLSPFIEGINKQAGEEVYVFFRKLNVRMKEHRELPPATTEGARVPFASTAETSGPPHEAA
ncbi:MAG TPA: hypothetical protein VEJ19_08410 [Nitrososphaerales archaeon]|nr:hypothetical protein [Nitrososphaerales archaeon]